MAAACTLCNAFDNADSGLWLLRLAANFCVFHPYSLTRICANLTAFWTSPEYTPAARFPATALWRIAELGKFKHSAIESSRDILHTAVKNLAREWFTDDQPIASAVAGFSI
jgi:hypothetical protein